MAQSPQGESKSFKQMSMFKVVGYSKQTTPMMTTASNRFNKEAYGGVPEQLRGSKKSGTR